MNLIVPLAAALISGAFLAPAPVETASRATSAGAPAVMQALRGAAGLPGDVILAAELVDVEGRAAGRVERIELTLNGAPETVWIVLGDGGQLALPIERFAYEPSTGRLVADAGLGRLQEWAQKDAAGHVLVNAPGHAPATAAPSPDAPRRL